MNRLLVAFAIMVVVALCFGTSGAAATTPNPLVVPTSGQWDMQASQSGRQYRIFVAWPEAPAPASGYRVLYVLDANLMYLTAVEAVRAQTRSRAQGRVGNAGDADKALTVVVGIGYPPGADIPVERAIDLSLPGVVEPDVPAGSGGGDAFLDFVEKDLKPVIEARFHIDRNRQAIVGHSLSGLFVLHALATRPEAFQIYLAASPSIWYANRAIRRELDTFVATRSSPAFPIRALLSAGELEGRDQVKNGREVATQLDALDSVDAQFVEFQGETHPTVVPAAISRGVRYMMDNSAERIEVPPMPTAQEYFNMTPEQRYQLRMKVRSLPDAQRIPWVTEQYHVLHDGLTKEQSETLHEERDRMDREHNTKPHLKNAQLDNK